MITALDGRYAVFLILRLKNVLATRTVRKNRESSEKPERPNRPHQ